MNKKRSLSKEINGNEYVENTHNALDVSVDKIKVMVNNQIFSASVERTAHTMKSKKKMALIAVAATLVMGITVFAASGIISQWFSSSSSIPDYKTLPTAEQVIKDIGYEAVIIDEFSNGYKFDNGSIVDNALADETGNVAEKFKSVMFRYEKSGDEVFFSQAKYNSAVKTSGEVITNVNGIDLYYYSYTNKLVPGNYKMTEEDKKAEESGELVFSYGMDEVTISEVQSVSWIKDGIHYQLMQIDGKLSADELADMAAEVIKK